jgi:RNA polymerase sigma-70 factor (ECF subfamily)
MMTADVSGLLSEVHRAEWSRLVATLVRITGDWSLAEDCAQDAFATALRVWPERGIPANCAAWLTTVAKNAALDRLRRARSQERARRELRVLGELEAWPAGAGRPGGGATVDDASQWPDDRLRLIFTCCHPALSMENRVALTLRSVAGISVDRIAALELTTPDAMAKRLVRARAKIRNAGIPYEVPSGPQLAAREASVLNVLYLIFTEGYGLGEPRATQEQGHARSDDELPEPAGRDESPVPDPEEAIWLARLVRSLMPQSTEAAGLLALMLLQHARRRSRRSASGDIVTLEHQDRSTWDRRMIDGAMDVLDGLPTASGRPVGPYELQACIAACHATARSASETDFAVIVSLYDQLAAIAPSPVVALNRAAAIALAGDVERALALLEELGSDPAMRGYYLLPAVRGDLLCRLERNAEAVGYFERAAILAPSEAERRFLSERARTAS